MIIVSHGYAFLDQVCTKIVDTEGGVAHEYDGNYSRFLQLKQGKYKFLPSFSFNDHKNTFFWCATKFSVEKSS